MSFDFGACARRTRSARSASALPRRPDEELVFVEDLPRAGARLLLDTCVYIDGLKGKIPPALDALIETRAVYHSAVALAELAFSFGRLGPGDPHTPGVLAAAEALILSIPGHRLLTPGPEDWTEGAIRGWRLASSRWMMPGDAKPSIMPFWQRRRPEPERLS